MATHTVANDFSEPYRTNKTKARLGNPGLPSNLTVFVRGDLDIIQKMKCADIK